MFQVVQPMQTVNIDGQEALFIPANSPQLSGAQTVQIGGQQHLITPSGQIIRAMQPTNLLQNMTQAVQLPSG